VKSSRDELHTATPLHREDCPGPVEIHDRLEPGKLNESAFHAMFQRCVIRRNHRVMSLADSLVHIGHHAVRHKFHAYLRAIFDMGVLIQEGEPLQAEDLEHVYPAYCWVDPHKSLALLVAVAESLFRSTDLRIPLTLPRASWIQRRLGSFLVLNPNGSRLVAKERPVWLLQKMIIEDYGFKTGIKKRIQRIVGTSK
ncbi:MAG: hypothetical protein V3T77_07025, partial [Planctomycetota bacterium]